MSTDTNELIRWKTDAWKDPAMVAWYSQRMVENSGTNRLKNRLEVDLCLAHARAETVIDVGIGTGRGSLPLAARGMHVTGVDSSQAMLDECQRLARVQGLEVAAKVASLDRLPFSDGEFDTLVSLNVLVHFPNWRDILPEWARVVKSGGRLVFDVHSLDHVRAAAGHPVTEEELLAIGAGNYQMRLAVEDLVAEADRRGLAVIAAVPYGAFLGGGNRNFLLGDLETRHYWSRLLSWLASDERFFELALFLEQGLIAHLTTSVTGRFMVVLENRPDAAGNRQWLERHHELEAILHARPLAVADLLARVPDGATWRQRLAGHLADSLHGRRLAELLARPLVESGCSDWHGLFGEFGGYFADLAAKRAADALATDLSRRLPAEPAAVAAALQFENLPLGEGCEYFLLECLLTQAFGRFSGVRS